MGSSTLAGINRDDGTTCLRFQPRRLSRACLFVKSDDFMRTPQTIRLLTVSVDQGARTGFPREDNSS